MDSDILFNRRETLFNMYRALLQKRGCQRRRRPARQGRFAQGRKSWRDRISLATSEMNGGDPGRMTGQLYCIRADVARRIYLPKDLGIDDGFIKAVVCTDFFSKELNPGRHRYRRECIACLRGLYIGRRASEEPKAADDRADHCACVGGIP